MFLGLLNALLRCSLMLKQLLGPALEALQGLVFHLIGGWWDDSLPRTLVGVIQKSWHLFFNCLQARSKLGESVNLPAQCDSLVVRVTPRTYLKRAPTAIKLLMSPCYIRVDLRFSERIRRLFIWTDCGFLLRDWHGINWEFNILS
jgi:hypothetical protein